MTQPKLQLTTHRLDPAEAEIRIDGAADVSGRFMGPRCHYASTVEVAYYVKPRLGGGSRAILPEPSYWDPQTPFLYEAILRIGDGEALKRAYGLRTVELTAKGWRVNRKPFRVEGVFRRELNDAADLRAAGVNTVLCPVTAATASVWNEADILGFFVVGLLSNEANAIAIARELKEHPSCLAWIVDEADSRVLAELPFVGLRAAASVAAAEGIRFLAGPALPVGSALPWLHLGAGSEDTVAPLGRVRDSIPNVF